jgi:hypothetical protein
MAAPAAMSVPPGGSLLPAANAAAGALVVIWALVGSLAITICAAFWARLIFARRVVVFATHAAEGHTTPPSGIAGPPESLGPLHPPPLLDDEEEDCVEVRLPEDDDVLLALELLLPPSVPSGPPRLVLLHPMNPMRSTLDASPASPVTFMRVMINRAVADVQTRSHVRTGGIPYTTRDTR